MAGEEFLMRSFGAKQEATSSCKDFHFEKFESGFVHDLVVRSTLTFEEEAL